MRTDGFITKEISVLLHLSGNVSAATKVINNSGRFKFFFNKDTDEAE